jgi:acyl-protein synthetase LuxE
LLFRVIFAVMITGASNRIFEVGKAGFTGLALDIFHFQYQHNPIYRSYTDLLRINPAGISEIEQIPFLPVSFFKTHEVRTTVFTPEIVFESSGTTGTGGSRHEVKDLSLYKKSFTAGFELFYGPVTDWCVIGLLPAYLERSNSSLVLMADELIRMSGHADSGFYLYEHEKLAAVLQQLEARGQKTLLIGVTFALLDFAENYSLQLEHTVVMETGGMKGRRKEITRQELQDILTKKLGLGSVHAEYGMTELLSQAYSAGQGMFETVPWMKALVRREDDPFDIRQAGEGILNIIDLANIYSCAFLATEDIGKVHPDGCFEVSGRVDNSDIRGCSLLVV